MDSGSRGRVHIADGTAEVGYRVAESATGRGIATAGVLDMLATARRLGLRQVRAGTSAANEASSRVLSRCGFVELDGRRPDDRDWHIDLA